MGIGARPRWRRPGAVRLGHDVAPTRFAVPGPGNNGGGVGMRVWEYIAGVGG